MGKNGMGAANNWGDGYQSGEAVYEDIMEMIDREADGSDSLEVSDVSTHIFAYGRIRANGMRSGIHDAAFYRRRYWIGSGIVSPRAAQRPVPQENHTDLLRLPQHNKRPGCGGSSLQ